MDIVLKQNSQQTEKVSGKFFSVISATAKFIVELDGRIRREVRAGSKVPSDGFKRVSFFETEGVTNTIVYEVSDVAAVEGEVQVSGLSEETFDYPYLMSATGATLTVQVSVATALPLVISISNVNYTRKSFHVVNRTGANDLGIYDTDGHLLDVCNTNTDRTFFFKQDVNLKGIGGNAIIALYYTLYNTTPQ